MPRNSILTVVVLVAALAALVFLLGGPHKVLVGLGLAKDGGGADAPGALSGREGTEDPEGRTKEGPGVPVLFGRPLAERKGTGGLLALVVKFEGQTPIPGAVAVLSGTGHGGEDVKVEATSDATGHLSFLSVPAGDGYVLRIDARGEAPTTVPDLSVRAGVTRDLGAVFVGKKGVLTGRVVDEAGVGVVGADVRVYTGYGSLADLLNDFVEIFATLDREPTAVQKGTSGSGGKFQFDGLSPGPYVVRAVVPGRKQAFEKAQMTPDGAAGGTVTLVVVAGEPIAGTVVTEAGKGIPKAALAFLAEKNDDPTSFLLERVFATTDDEGKFRIAVDGGNERWRAIVVAEGFPQTMTTPMEPGKEDVRIVLRSGTVLEITVVDRDTGLPLSGAQVMAAVSDTGDSFMGGETEGGGGFFARKTDARGIATFDSRPGFLEMVMVSHPTHAPVMAAPSREGIAIGGEGTGLVGDVDREIHAGRVNRLRVALAGGVTLVGRVKDANEKGIAGAEVRSFGLGLVGNATSAVTGPDGAYRLEGLLAMQGQAAVMVKAPGYVLRDEAMSMGGVKVPENATGEVQHDFVMDPAATVRGRVVDADGRGVGGVSVRLHGGMLGLQALLLGGAQGTTGSDGWYVLFDVAGRKASPEVPPPPGSEEYAGALAGMNRPRVLASAPGYVTGRSEPFEVPPGATVDAPLVTLKRGAAVSGKVVDPGARPVAHAFVEVAVETAQEDFSDLMGFGDANRPRTARTAADGTFAVGSVPAGKGTVTVTAAGLAPTRASVTIEGERSPEPVEVRMRPAREARGRVVGPDGRGVAGVTVTIAGGLEGREGDAAWVSPTAATTDANGDFTLKNLPPGRVLTSLRAKGFKSATATVEAGGSSVEVRLSAVDPDAARRLQEISQELMTVVQQMQTAKDSDTKQALQKRLMDLVEEQRRLQKEAGDQPGK